jgi:transcriptional regulator with XRE-family HTH domain
LIIGNSAKIVIMSPFGDRLRRWRQRRGLSQLALAGLVGSTARHISFLETGRSRPSERMVLRLAGCLSVGLRESNELLRAAGLGPKYRESTLDSQHLDAYRRSLERLLSAHDPYPAMVLDRRFTVVTANHAALTLFGAGLAGANFVRDALVNPAGRSQVANWPEVAAAGLARLHQQASRYPFDEELQTLVRDAESILPDLECRVTSADPAVCPTFVIGGTTVRTLAMVARFEPPSEVTVEELHVELMYPADEIADKFFHERFAGRTFVAPMTSGPTVDQTE